MSQFLQVNEVDAGYDGNTIVKTISFSLREGELACLLGPSGCGKTTILRAISGFQNITHGHITLDNQTLSKPSYILAPEKRHVGMVFQDHALFPHLTLAENIAFGLHKKTAQDKKSLVQQMLNLVGMSGYEKKYPHELSGGQSQRIALARALAPQPKLLLLDEPFSNLDTELREKLGYEVRNLLKQQGITAIMVTHDQHDAFALGDQVGVMSEGKLLQWDTPFNLYHTPNSRFVANFIGDGIFVKGTMVEDNVVITNFGEIRGESVSANYINQEVDVLIRPDDVIYKADSPIRGQITRKAFKGAQTLYSIKLDSSDTLLCLLPSHDDYEIGDTIGIEIDADHLVCFNA